MQNMLASYNSSSALNEAGALAACPSTNTPNHHHRREKNDAGPKWLPVLQATTHILQRNK